MMKNGMKEDRAKKIVHCVGGRFVRLFMLCNALYCSKAEQQMQGYVKL